MKIVKQKMSSFFENNSKLKHVFLELEKLRVDYDLQKKETGKLISDSLNIEKLRVSQLRQKCLDQEVEINALRQSFSDLKKLISKGLSKFDF